MRRREIVWVVLACALCAGVVVGGAASASPDPYRDQAEKIACPQGPPGWTSISESDGGRYILTPLTVVAQVDDPTLIFGAPIVQVDCRYRSPNNRYLQMSVRYALPIDINPWTDFYIGCTSTGRPQPATTARHAWNDRERVYRVVGAKTWSLATFIDDFNAIPKAQEPRFEAMTNQMLRAAQPYAHDCKLAGGGKPVQLKAIWSFGFDVQTKKAGVTSSGQGSGSFVTTASPSGTTIGTISSLLATNFRLKLTSKGKTRSLTIRVGSPIAFQHSYGSLLRAHVVVAASNEPGCRTGSTGTLLVSLQSLTPPLVRVQVCGHSYLDGKGKVKAFIQTV
jgi:hypothetical protein